MSICSLKCRLLFPPFFFSFPVFSLEAKIVRIQSDILLKMQHFVSIIFDLIHMALFFRLFYYYYYLDQDRGPRVRRTPTLKNCVPESQHQRNRRYQSVRSAMDRPPPGETPSVIGVISAPGKYEPKIIQCILVIVLQFLLNGLGILRRYHFYCKRAIVIPIFGLLLALFSSTDVFVNIGRYCYLNNLVLFVSFTLSCI